RRLVSRVRLRWLPSIAVAVIGASGSSDSCAPSAATVSLKKSTSLSSSGSLCSGYAPATVKALAAAGAGGGGGDGGAACCGGPLQPVKTAHKANDNRSARKAGMTQTPV